MRDSASFTAAEPSHPPPLHREGPAAPAARRRFKWLILGLILLGVAAHLLSIKWGFLYDDYIHQFMLRRIDPAGSARVWNLFDFGSRPDSTHPLHKWGFYPWWTDPDFKIRFCRPITSLSLAADYGLFGDWAPGYHLTSIALFAILLLLAHRLYSAFGLPPSAVLWASVILALTDVNVLPVGWLANRNALLTALFLTAMLLALHACRQRPSPPRIALAVLLFLLACGSKESGIIGLPLAFLHAMLYPPEGTSATPRSRMAAVWRSRPLWALATVAMAYVCYYVWAGYGTQSLLYAAPWRTPIEYLGRLAVLYPLAGLSLFFGVSTDLLAATGGTVWWALAASGILLVLAVTIMLRTTRLTPAVAMGIGIIVLSLLPEAGADLSDRLYLNASLGTSLLIGLFLHHLSPWKQTMTDGRWAAVALGTILILRSLLLAVPNTLVRGHFFHQMGRFDRMLATSADVDRRRPAPRTVIVLNSPDSLGANTILATWAVEHEDDGTRFHLIQMGRRGLTVRRQDERSLLITCSGRPFGDERFERLFRTGRPMEPGKIHYKTGAFAAIPIDVEPTGPRTVLFEFDNDLDNETYQFLAWQNGRLLRMRPPAAGETMQIQELARPFPFAP